MRKSQVRKSTRGTFPSCSTGHFSVSDCPGGNRPSLRRCCSSFLRSLLSPKITVASFACVDPSRERQSPDWRVISQRSVGRYFQVVAISHYLPSQEFGVRC